MLKIILEVKPNFTPGCKNGHFTSMKAELKGVLALPDATGRSSAFGYLMRAARPPLGPNIHERLGAVFELALAQF